jgi:hypothetical protein
VIHIKQVDGGLEPTIYATFNTTVGLKPNLRKSIYNVAISNNMATHMKTTLDLSDALFFDAKLTAKQHQTTMRALIETGLRRVLDELKAPNKPAFKLRNASVAGGAVAMDAKDIINSQNDMALERHLRLDAQLRQQNGI